MYEEWSKNETYGGAIEAFHTGEIDFACNTFLGTLERQAYVMFLPVMYHFK